MLEARPPWAMVKAGGEKDKGVGVEKVYVVLDEEGREKVCVTWGFLEYPLGLTHLIW